MHSVAQKSTLFFCQHTLFGFNKVIVSHSLIQAPMLSVSICNKLVAAVFRNVARIAILCKRFY